MNIQDAIFAVIKRDDEVLRDDPYYGQDTIAIGVLHDYLINVKHEPYLSYVSSIENEAESQVTREDVSKAKDCLGGLSPHEINLLMEGF